MAWDPFDEYFNDPEFRKLAGPDKIAVLSRVDPEFAQLPIKEQANAVQAYLNTPSAGKGVLETVADALGGTALSLVHPVEAFRAASQAQELERQRAAEASQSGHPFEAFGHRLAAGMPVWIGPMAGQAGEDIGEGRTAQGLTEAGMALGPSALGGAARAIPPSARFLKGAAKASPAAFAAASKTWPVWSTELVPGMPHWLAPAVTAAAGAPELIRGGLAEMRGEQYPPAPIPSVGAPPVRFPERPAPVSAPPVTFPPAASTPTPKPAPPVTFPPVGEEPAPPPTRTYPAPPVRFRKTANAKEEAGPTAPPTIPPVVQVVTPPETLPSQDWRFEDARDMARLLNQHGINPADLEANEWTIAAPALKRNLGVPNPRAQQLVMQEWNKLQPRGQ